MSKNISTAMSIYKNDNPQYLEIALDSIIGQTLKPKEIVNEWICSDMATWRMCMGIPAHLSKSACVSDDYIWKYSNNGYKDITEMKISDLVIYDKPKELSEFHKPTLPTFLKYEDDVIKRPPQSWCYVESEVQGE